MTLIRAKLLTQERALCVRIQTNCTSEVTRPLAKTPEPEP